MNPDGSYMRVFRGGPKDGVRENMPAGTITERVVVGDYTYRAGAWEKVTASEHDRRTVLVYGEDWYEG